MERLTKRNSDGVACSAKPFEISTFDMVDKLAAYEDAEEQGRFVKLPCKVGDTFFFLSETIHGEIYVGSSRVSQIVITDHATILIDVCGCYHYDYWLTREEAETALRRQ